MQEQELTREEMIECILREALIYCHGMDVSKDREQVVKNAVAKLLRVFEQDPRS